MVDHVEKMQQKQLLAASALDQVEVADGPAPEQEMAQSPELSEKSKMDETAQCYYRCTDISAVEYCKCGNKLWDWPIRPALMSR